MLIDSQVNSRRVRGRQVGRTMGAMLSPSLLVLLGLASAAPPASRELLHAQCRRYASEPRNPWALAHGIALDGRAFKAKDGREAADVIVSDFLRRDEAPGGKGLYFDAFAADGTPVEP